MTSSSFPASLTRSWPLAVLLLIATIWLYKTPYSASNLEVPPDTVEYALAPLELLETGRYEIVIEGRGLPPRYPPWFPAFVILPAYVLFGHEPGNAILPITLLAVAGVGFAYAIGKRLSSTTGGILAALALLMLPSYSAWATQVMTDVPCTALMLGACLVYMQLRLRPHSTLLYHWAGVLVAVATLFRPVFAAMLLPFLLATLRSSGKNLFFRIILLLAPMAAAVAATSAYNSATFGSALRNGYNLWAPVPMDYPTMIFSPSYLLMNLREIGIGFPILVLVCSGGWLLARTRRNEAFTASWRSLRDVLVFFILTTVPILVFHLFYFYPDDRFHIPMMAGTAVLAGAMLALFIGHRRESVIKVLLPAVFLLAVGARIATPGPVPQRRLAAERVRANTPENAIVISAIDPVYLARLAGHGSTRRIVPLSRNVEYASALLVRKRVDDPRLHALNWRDGRALAIIRPHGEEAVRFVANERVEELALEIERGTPVFLESAFVDDSEAKFLAQLQTRFKLVQRVPYLYELRLP